MVLGSDDKEQTTPGAHTNSATRAHLRSQCVGPVVLPEQRRRVFVLRGGKQRRGVAQHEVVGVEVNHLQQENNSNTSAHICAGMSAQLQGDWDAATESDTCSCGCSLRPTHCLPSHHGPQQPQSSPRDTTYLFKAREQQHGRLDGEPAHVVVRALSLLAVVRQIRLRKQRRQLAGGKGGLFEHKCAKEPASVLVSRHSRA